MNLLDLFQECPNLVVSIKVSDLIQANTKLVATVIDQANKANTERANDHLMSREEVMKTLNISASTLWRWQKSGYLLPINVGGQRRYRFTDINEIMEGAR